MPQKSVNKSDTSYQPKKTLSTIDAIAIIVGIVIGAGVFKTPSLVALNTSNDVLFLLAWLAGGGISLVGALSYAELCATYPHTGGDYHFLYRAYGRPVAFLFAWTRMVVIQTGSIALLAFIFGDYATQFYPIGPYSEGIYALAIVLILTFINILGLTFGATAQKLFTLLEVGGILLIIVVGLFFTPISETSLPPTKPVVSISGSLGMAMVFVLLTFGGWNEAAYISAELKKGARGMASALLWSILIITIVYLLVNYTYIRVLGHEQMASSDAVAADLMRYAWGENAAKFIGLLVAISALTSANATIITGARSNYALGQDFPFFKRLSQWNHQTSSPVKALIVQGLLATTLVLLGLMTRRGFETIVDYTAPVFWFFFLLVGAALFILRKKDPETPRPFKVPFYPILPAVFCVSSTFLLYSSLVYTGIGAVFGVFVLLVGFLVFIVLRR